MLSSVKESKVNSDTEPDTKNINAFLSTRPCPPHGPHHAQIVASIESNKRPVRMPVQNEVKAWITIGGEQVPEYRPHFDETSGERRVFIEAIAGKEFAIHYKCQKHRVNCKLVIDDEHMRPDSCLSQGKTASIRGVMVQKNQLRPFVFNSVRLTSEDSEACHNTKVIEDAGMIRLEYKRCREDVIDKTKVDQIRAPTDPSNKVFHEEGKKATISHTTELGEVKTTTSKNWYIPQILDVNPWITIVYMYRSRALLEANGIVPTLHARPVTDPRKRLLQEQSSSRFHQSDSRSQRVDPPVASTSRLIEPPTPTMSDSPELERGAEQSAVKGGSSKREAIDVDALDSDSDDDAVTSTGKEAYEMAKLKRQIEQDQARYREMQSRSNRPNQSNVKREYAGNDIKPDFEAKTSRRTLGSDSNEGCK